MKKLEIEKTKSTFIISTFKTDIIKVEEEKNTFFPEFGFSSRTIFSIITRLLDF